MRQQRQSMTDRADESSRRVRQPLAIILSCAIPTSADAFSPLDTLRHDSCIITACREPIWSGFGRGGWSNVRKRLPLTGFGVLCSLPTTTRSHVGAKTDGGHAGTSCVEERGGETKRRCSTGRSARCETPSARMEGRVSVTIQLLSAWKDHRLAASSARSCNRASSLVWLSALAICWDSLPYENRSVRFLFAL